jgi:adenylate cyclase
MPTGSSALHRGRQRLFRRILAISAVIGASYGMALHQPGLSAVVSVAVGLVNGCAIAGAISGIEIFLLRPGSPASRRLTRMPFALVVLLKTAVYAAIVSLFVMGAPWLAALLPGNFGYRPLDPHTNLATIGFSLAMTLVIVMLMQAAALVGRRTFRDLILGRYRRPRPERRFFLFVDVVGSTAIAERLGALQAHRFLAAVFSATAEPIAAAGGDIYQYVGDEIVVTWTEDEGRRDQGNEALPLRCFFDMEAALAARAAEFRQNFGAEPRLRAALHLGDVIAGEVGDQRRAIVFHGDVMNTASRLEQATREVGARFIASDAAVSGLGQKGGFQLKDLGELALRGRTGSIRAWAVEHP